MSIIADRVLAIAHHLEAADIPFAIGGALALAYSVQEPRGTRDIDVNVFVPITDVEKVFSALPDAVSYDDDDRRSVERDGQVRLHWDETPVDLFFSMHAFHEAAQRHARLVPFVTREILVLDATHLTVFKAFFNRTKDWADIEEMAAAGTIDAPTAVGWLDELLGADDDRSNKLRALLAS